MNVDQDMQHVEPAANAKREPQGQVTGAVQLKTEKRTDGRDADDKVPTTGADVNMDVLRVEELTEIHVEEHPLQPWRRTQHCKQDWHVAWRMIL